ncbi:MAG: hypothetical protein E6G97_16820 [Alphaproteobacteria bacterium]|nr:MAG: hypothetical protein E6G97_16820 [Alphaproteobacteria bacterium]
MATSIFLAKLIGPLALALGVGVLVNRATMRAVLDEFIRNPALIFIAGMITFPAGLAIVLTHNVWVASWPVLITVIGWLITIAGALRLAAPHQAIKFGRRVFDQPNGVLFGGAIWIVIGAILTFFGYVR